MDKFFFSKKWVQFILYIVLGFAIYCIVNTTSKLGLMVGIEISMMTVIGLLEGGKIESSEGLVKYFLVQVIGSFFFMVYVVWMSSYKYFNYVELVLVFGLLIKLGMFPFHYWVPSVCSSLSWESCFVVLIVQKVFPIWVLLNDFLEYGEKVNHNAFSLFLILAVLTGIVGCIGGLWVTDLRVVMAYSSMIHLGSILMLCVGFEGMGIRPGLVYYLVYGFISCCLMVCLNKLNIYTLVDVTKNGVTVLWVSLFFLSFAGIPPFLGLVMKVCFILFTYKYLFEVCVVLCLCSIVSVFMYLVVFVNMFLSHKKSTKVVSSDWGYLLLSLFVNVVLTLLVFYSCGLFLS